MSQAGDLDITSAHNRNLGHRAGRRPNPEAAAGPGNLPAAFHVYSMRQAIEEGFILDVLKNYTPYTLAFKLASEGKEWDEKEVERSEAMKGIMRWVRLPPYNITQKVQVVVEHFRENVAPLLSGHAKAMAVRWQLAIEKYIKALLNEIIAKVNTLFEGELTDDDKLVYVNRVLKGKLLESAILVQQAGSNTKDQFASSPDLSAEIMNAIIDAFAANTTMSKQALDSEKVREGLRDILLGPAQLYEALRSRGAAKPMNR